MKKNNSVEIEESSRPSQNKQFDYKQSFTINKIAEELKGCEKKKNYSVWDGITHYHFWTLQEARTYVFLQAEKNKYLYETSKEIYKQILNIYVEKYLCFGKASHIEYNPKSILESLIFNFDFLKNSYRIDLLPSKIWVIYKDLLSAAKILEAKFLVNRINDIYTNFSPKPEYEYTLEIVKEQIKENDIARKRKKKRKVIEPICNNKYAGDSSARTKQMRNEHIKKVAKKESKKTTLKTTEKASLKIRVS